MQPSRKEERDKRRNGLAKLGVDVATVASSMTIGFRRSADPITVEQKVFTITSPPETVAVGSAASTYETSVTTRETSVANAAARETSVANAAARETSVANAAARETRSPDIDESMRQLEAERFNSQLQEIADEETVRRSAIIRTWDTDTISIAVSQKNSLKRILKANDLTQKLQAIVGDEPHERDAVIRSEAQSMTSLRSLAKKELERTLQLVKQRESRGPCRYYFDSVMMRDKLILVDEQGNTLAEIPTNVYKCSKEDIDLSGCDHSYQLNNNEYLITNPKTTSSAMRPCHSHDWVVKEMLLSDRWLIDTNWDIEFVIIPPTQFSTKKIYVIPKLENTTIPSGMHYLPLLETIHHIHQEYRPMTLQQIAILVEKRYLSIFGDQLTLSKYLFEHFRVELNKICQVERIPISQVFRSEFRATYKYFDDPASINNTITKARTMRKTYMIASSYLSADTSYGNIPWLLNANKVIEQNTGKILLTLPSHIFLSEDTLSRNAYGSILYDIVTVFPNITYDGKLYKSGSYMGIHESGHGVRDIVIRGDLFESISVREYLVLIELYKAFSRNMLVGVTSLNQIYTQLPLSDKDNQLRDDFIDMIYAQLTGDSKHAAK